MVTYFIKATVTLVTHLFMYLMNITHLLSMYYILGIAVSSDNAKIYEKLFLPS